MHICAPKNKWELSDMMKFAVALDAPIAVRYPRGTAYAGLAEHRAPIELGKAEWIAREGGIALFAVGSMVKTAEEVQKLLHERVTRQVSSMPDLSSPLTKRQYFRPAKIMR